MDWDEYCKLDRMNASTLVYAAHSMKRMKRIMDSGFGEESDAMRLGTGIHVLLLEPDEFEERFVVMPDFENDIGNMRAAKRKDEPDKERRTTSKQTKYYKAKAAHFKQTTDKSILTRAEYDTALHAIEELRSRPHIVEVLDQCEKEQTLLGEIHGVPFKGRVDLLRVKRPLVVDLKTTKDCHKSAFGKQFMRLRYDMKLAIYRELATQRLGEKPEVAVITQEVEGDFDNTFVPVSDAVLDNAWGKVVKLLAKYVEAKKENYWPGVDGGKKLYELVIPNWAMEEDDEMDWSDVESKEEPMLEPHF